MTLGVILTLFAALNSYALSNSEKDMKPIATYEKGKLYQQGPFKVAVLSGSFYEMGEQLGFFQKKVKIQDF